MEIYKTLFLHFGSRKIFFCVLTSFSLAFLEGAGVMMLVPMLNMVGLTPSGGITEEINRFFLFLFDSLGLPKTLPTVLILFVVIVCFREMLARWQAVLAIEVNHSIVQELRKRLFTAVCHAEWQYLVKTHRADFTHAFTNDINRIGQGVFNLIHALSTLLIIGVYFLLAINLSFFVTSLVFLTSAFVFFLLRKQVVVSKTTGRELTGIGRKFHAEISEFLGSMKLTKIFGTEENVVGQFTETTSNLQKNILAYAKETAGIKMRFKIISVLILALYIHFAVEVMAIPVEGVLLLLFIFVRITPLASSLLQSSQQFFHMSPAFTSYLALEKECIEAREKKTSAKTEKLAVEEGIKLENVSFQYDEKNEGKTLSSLSIQFPARKTIAIIGRSGAGKSTLADILMGLLIPHEGNILIDGILLDENTLLSWRMAVAYVPQDVFLFHDTVRANLLWVKLEASDEELWEALATAAAKDFITDLPEGLDTVVGERGVMLSGGERQRIALARALLTKPNVLILDEATSSLDQENETYIREAINKLHGNITIIIIAHRMTTIRDADMVLILNKGEITGSGTWEELTNVNSLDLSLLSID